MWRRGVSAAICAAKSRFLWQVTAHPTRAHFHLVIASPIYPLPHCSRHSRLSIVPCSFDSLINHIHCITNPPPHPLLPPNGSHCFSKASPRCRGRRPFSGPAFHPSVPGRPHCMYYACVNMLPLAYPISSQHMISPRNAMTLMSPIHFPDAHLPTAAVSILIPTNFIHP